MAFEHPGAAKYYEQITFRRKGETHGAKLGSPLHFPSMNHEPHDSDEDFVPTKPALSDEISSCAEHRAHPESVSRPVKPEFDEKAAKSPLIKRKLVDFSQNFPPVTHEQDFDQGGRQAVPR